MIVVIGASGFLGSHLLCHLVQGNNKVRAIYRNHESILATEHYLNYYNLPKNIFKEKVEWVKADVLDIETLCAALDGASFVYNCSGFVSFDKRDKKQMIAVNALGTSNIVNACLKNNCLKLVHVSSIAALGDTNTLDPITEDTQWIRTATESWYSITKFNAETEAWRGIAEGLPTVIVNPSVILGPGNWTKGSPKLFNMVFNGLKYYTTGIVGYVDVRDVCRIMILAMESSIEGERYLISGSNQSFKDLFTGIASAMNKPVPNRKASPTLLSLAWRLDLIRSLLIGTSVLITKNSARTAIKQRFYSSQKAQQSFSFEFTSFEETIRYTSNCYLKDIQ